MSLLAWIFASAFVLVLGYIFLSRNTHGQIVNLDTIKALRWPTEEKIARRKSLVRVAVTYGAAAFLFPGGAAFIIFLILTNRWTAAIDLFNSLLPVAAAIISFWFAGRSGNTKPDSK